jgi:hypothetical protein
MINYYEEFATEVEAQGFMVSVYKSYPQGGYSTSLRLHENKENGRWYVTGYRFSSCD